MKKISEHKPLLELFNYQEELEVSKETALEKINQIYSNKCTGLVLVENINHLNNYFLEQKDLCGKHFIDILFRKTKQGLVINKYLKTRILEHKLTFPTIIDDFGYLEIDKNNYETEKIFFQGEISWSKRDLFSFKVSYDTKYFIFYNVDDSFSKRKRNYYPFEDITQEIMNKYKYLK